MFELFFLPMDDLDLKQKQEMADEKVISEIVRLTQTLRINKANYADAELAYNILVFFLSKRCP